MDFFGLGYFVIEEDQNFEMAKHIFNYGNMKFAITTKKNIKKTLSTKQFAYLAKNEPNIK